MDRLEASLPPPVNEPCVYTAVEEKQSRMLHLSWEAVTSQEDALAPSTVLQVQGENVTDNSRWHIKRTARKKQT